MVEFMLKKNWFLIAILVLYLLFLCKDLILGFFDNTSDLTQMIYDEKLEYYKEEYESMQEILGISYDYNIIYSKVLLREIYAFYDEVTIGKGSSDGIKTQDLVVNERGVVGVVKSAGENSSVVSLLTNPDTSLSVKINDSYGILTSVDNTIIVKNIKLNQEINVGDAVYTSGLTGIPGDIFIGYVTSIQTDSLELEYILKVDSIAHLQDIKYVAVLSSDVGGLS